MNTYANNRVTVDLSALISNLNQVKRLVGPGNRIMGVVKADAYGHGQAAVSRALEKSGVPCLGVAFLWEALSLREVGIRCPVVILSGVRTVDEAEAVVEKGLTPFIFDPDTAEILAREAERRRKRISILIKVDSGMGRLGIRPSETLPFLERIRSRPFLFVEGLASHLSSADEPDRDFTERQIHTFRELVEQGRSLGLELPHNTLANSAGIMAYPDSHFGMVRPGIMLYGGLPSPDFQPPVSLKPVMHFSARVLQVRDFPDQTPVSYSRTYYTKGPKKIAVISAGYSDGLPRQLSNRGEALIRGRRVAIVGRVCMNLLMCDVTGREDVVPGDEAVFLGRQGNAAITGDQMAESAETISYEIFCAIGQSHMKEYTS